MNDVSELCATATSGNYLTSFVSLSAASISVALLSTTVIHYNPHSSLYAPHGFFLLQFFSYIIPMPLHPSLYIPQLSDNPCRYLQR
jgi:hypothetical protein